MDRYASRTGVKVCKNRDVEEIELFGEDDTAFLWDNVWGPNDRDFFNNFRPDLHSDALIEPQF